ncbi:hypothetical protein M3Y97_00146200 [Aphelenchoides bicaudatus]|nr:hypothetical protein M3Y97_00146200 [Aphelenchoides bicaudatus]
MKHHIFVFVVLAVSCLADSDAEYYDNDEKDATARRQAYSLDPGAYNPNARDFTERCMRLAQYSGEKACETFNICCSEDNVLNKLNGDKCQISDPTNGCNLDMAGIKIQWSQCRAFNCSDEITTTSTTTIRPSSSTSQPAIVTRTQKSEMTALLRSSCGLWFC